MGNSRETIIMVDDDITSLTVARNNLADKYNLFTAPSGEKLFMLLEKLSPALILLDIEMPDMNGFDVIARLKQNPFLDRIPVIFLTASHDAEIEIRALKSGARDFITKPVEKSILHHRIELHLRFASYQAQTEQNVTILSDSLATSFAEMIECRDENTGGHVVRTSKYIEILGRNLINRDIFPDELNHTELQLMARAAPLHDIGKIAISDSILLKEGKLNDEEFTIMKRHAHIGEVVVDKMYQRMPAQRYLHYGCLIAGSHHERYDGRGYPRGLAGEDIPLCGRMMAVVDVYDALTENRIYRKGMGSAQASKIIMENRGTQFDPVVVDTFNDVQDQIIEITNTFSNKEKDI